MKFRFTLAFALILGLLHFLIFTSLLFIYGEGEGWGFLVLYTIWPLLPLVVGPFSSFLDATGSLGLLGIASAAYFLLGAIIGFIVDIVKRKNISGELTRG